MTENKDVMVALKKFENLKKKQKLIVLKLGEFLTMHFHLFSIFKNKLKKTYGREKMLQNVSSNEYHNLLIILS